MGIVDEKSHGASKVRQEARILFIEVLGRRKKYFAIEMMMVIIDVSGKLSYLCSLWGEGEFFIYQHSCNFTYKL
jgi:hypothetical protein